MKVVCTGRSGGIGARLPAEVVGLSTRLEAPVQQMTDELWSFAPIPDVLIHLAALTSVAECQADPARAFALNTDAPMKWLRAAAAVGVKRFVFVSTSHVFKATPTLEWLAPDRAPDAISPYGQSKAEAERRLLAAAAEAGVEVKIARIFSVISPGMRPGYLYPALIDRARTRDLSPLPGYRNTRDFISTEEAARALCRIALTRSARKIFHVCTGTPRTVKSLAEEVFAKYGYDQAELAPLFPDAGDEPNYMVSHPTEI
jgi:UDP-glucose 4-epimerase